MTISAVSALKYAVAKAAVWSYPRMAIYDFIKDGAGLDESPFTKEDVEKVESMLARLSSTESDPVSRIFRHDVVEVSKALSTVDPSYGPEQLLSLTADVNAFLEQELGAKPPRPLKLAIVDRFPHPYENAKATAWSLSKYESEMLGMPEGVYIRRDQVFPVAAECVLGHEYAHAAIQDLPNYVPWFDEGLADILGYAYYASRVGKPGDLRIWINFRNEMKTYGRWYAEYDRLVSCLVLTCGMEGIRTLVRLKREKPTRVDWTRLAEVLGENPDYQEVRACVKDEFPEREAAPPLYATLSTLFVSTTLAYTLSPEAYSVMLGLIEAGGKIDESLAFRGLQQTLRRSVERELFDHNLIYRSGKTIGVFGGEVLGSDQLFKSNLVRAEIRSTSFKRLWKKFR